MKFEEESLSDALFKKNLSEAEAEKLKTILRKGGKECDHLLDNFYDHHQMVQVGSQLQNGFSEKPPIKKNIIRFRVIVAAALVACGIYYFLKPSLDQYSALEREPVLAKWIKLSDDPTQQTEVERYVHSGTQKLPEGNYQLIFSNGTKVNLNNRAEIELLNEESMVLHFGNLLVEVSEETSSFKVRTPSAEVLDLGTVFGVRVNKEKDSNIYVQQGVVSVTSLLLDRKKVLRIHDQLDVNSKGEFSPIRKYRRPINETIPDIEDSPNREFLNWQHWSFEDDFMATNQINMKDPLSEVLPFKNNSEALPKVCESPYGKGIRFDGVNDGLVSTKVAMPTSEMSLSFWLRVPSALKGSLGASVLCFQNSKGAEGGLDIVLNPFQNEGLTGALKIQFNEGYLTTQTDLRDGRWHHIVVNFMKGEQADVSVHAAVYVDGVLEKVSGFSKSRIKMKAGLDEVLHLGTNADNGQSSFGGDIDELWLFEQALLPEEVMRLRDNNSPFNP